MISDLNVELARHVQPNRTIQPATILRGLSAGDGQNFLHLLLSELPHLRGGCMHIVTLSLRRPDFAHI